MTDQNQHTVTTTVNFRDWILGEGEFSEENLKKSRDGFFTKLGQHWGRLIQAQVEKTLADLDAVPEAKDRTAGELGGARVTGNTPTLTDEEREAIEAAVSDYEQSDDDDDCARMVSTLRKLLERLG